MAGVVVAVGENCDLMYGSEEWGIVHVRTPSMFGDLQSDDAQIFLIVVGEGLARSHRWRDQLAVSAGKRALLDLETHGRRDNWPGWHGFH